MALAKRTDFTCPNTDLAGNPLLAATLTSNDGGVTLPGQPDVPGLGICQYGSGFCDYDPEVGPTSMVCIMKDRSFHALRLDRCFPVPRTPIAYLTLW
jgi:hypothetical protein